MVGQYKDDAFKAHSHALTILRDPTVGGWYGTSDNNNFSAPGISGGAVAWTSRTTAASGVGNVTRGKRKGVKYIVKVL